jgi:hypothetical protein
VVLAGITVAGSLSLSRCNRERARDLLRCTKTLASGTWSSGQHIMSGEEKELNAMCKLAVRDLLE